LVQVVVVVVIVVFEQRLLLFLRIGKIFRSVVDREHEEDRDDEAGGVFEDPKVAIGTCFLLDGGG
jgi:hypothetical protein